MTRQLPMAKACSVTLLNSVQGVSVWCPWNICFSCSLVLMPKFSQDNLSWVSHKFTFKHSGEGAFVLKMPGHLLSLILPIHWRFCGGFAHFFCPVVFPEGKTVKLDVRLCSLFLMEQVELSVCEYFGLWSLSGHSAMVLREQDACLTMSCKYLNLGRLG